jgi:HAD superfamily hydrolase (TIGR01509 family)
MVIRAVVFDFDGTILDTEAPVFTAWVEAWAEHGVALELAEWSGSIGGLDLFDPYDELVARAAGPIPPREEFQVRRRARRDELLHAESPRPGVLAWLDEAVERGLGLAIASSSPPDWVERHLTRLGLRDRFAHVACCDGVVPPKPEPVSYRTACERLGVEPHEAIAVEDSPHGVAAAKGAGLFTVAVPHGLTVELDLSAADVVVESLVHLPLARAIALAEGGSGTP